MQGGLRPSDVKAVPNMTVCRYHFLDDLSFIRRPQDVFDMPAADLAKYIEAVERRFQEAGWEGDGTIGIIWLPPFVGVGIEDTWGSYLWHVKQSNNGTSWLGGDSDLLRLERLHQQNEKWLGDTHELAGLMFMNSAIVVRRSRKTIGELTRQVKELKTLSSTIVPEIVEKLFVVAQGEPYYVIARIPSSLLDPSLLASLVASSTQAPQKRLLWEWRPSWMPVERKDGDLSRRRFRRLL